MRYIFLLIILVFSRKVYCQQYQGNFISGYSGAIGVQNNPATFLHKSPKWDINLLGMGATVYTQYGYISDESISSLASKTNIIDASDSIPSNYNSSSDALFYANHLNGSITGLHFDAIAHLPSFVFKISNSISVGIFSNLRANFGAYNVPDFFDYYNLDTVELNVNQTIEPFHASGMAWGEIGVNLAKRFDLYNGNSLSIGINPKYLMGFEAMYVRNISEFNFIRNNDTINSSSANAEVGFSTGLSRTSDDYKFGVNGVGFGLDIGVEYAVLNSNYDEDSKIPYKLKIGGAIRDLGLINFNSNAEVHRYSINSIEQIPENITDTRDNNYDIIKRISDAIYGDSSSSKRANDFDIHLPTTLNAHIDYNIIDYLFINAYLSRAITPFVPQVEAPNIFMAGARYERRWLEAGVNASLIEDKWFGLGGYLRLGLLTVGSDHLASIFSRQPKLNGADIYMSLRILPFGKGGNREDEYRGFGVNRRKGDFGCFKL